MGFVPHLKGKIRYVFFSLWVPALLSIIGGVLFFVIFPDLYDEKGQKVTGFANDEGKTYYLDEKGVMQIGWVEVEDIWYYFNTSGAMATGWVKDGDNWYWLKTNGAMAYSTSVKVNGTTYNFNDKGVCTNP